MIHNKNFNTIVKRLFLDQVLYCFVFLSYGIGIPCTIIGLIGFIFNLPEKSPLNPGIFFLLIACIGNILWYSLQKYDKMYGLFNNQGRGCDTCKELSTIIKSSSYSQEYKMIFKNSYGEKILMIKNLPIFCPNCGRKISSL